MRKAILLGCAMAGFACAGNAVLYEGARLIIGDSSAPIENGAFVVENGRITAIGVRGAIKAPAGAARVDLTGKTVMPALNNVHLHIGYEGFVSWGPENHTAENVLDHLEREAFYGVGAVMSMGDQPDDFALKFQRDQKAGKFPAAAQFFFAAGLAPPGGGPDAVLIQGTNALHAIREVATPEQAVAAVRQIAAKKIPQIKFWVDERDNTRGGMKKLSPEIYSAIIAEAHRHGITVHAHAIMLADQKGVVKAGVDVLVHTVGNERIDDEFIALLKEKKPYWAPVMGLGDTADLCDDPNPFVEQSMPDSVVADVRAGKTWLRSNPCSAAPNTRRDDILKYNFSQMVAAGARIVLGSDAGVSAKLRTDLRSTMRSPCTSATG